MPGPQGSVSLSNGFRVAVAPSYIPEQSSPDRGQWIFAYRIRITNESAEPGRVVSRYWRIINADGVVREVEGEGVVGQQPRLAAGESFAYSSFCPLDTPWGTMEGYYVVHDDQGAAFTVDIARFYLAAPLDRGSNIDPDVSSASG